MDYLRLQKPKEPGLAPWRFLRALVPAIYLASVVAFLWDLFRQGTSAYGVTYALLVATSVLHRRKRGLWILTAITCLMVVIGGVFPIVAQTRPDSIGNRILSILAIVAIASFIHRDHLVRDRLAATKRRAEASERMKADVLTNLGREIPPSFHALLGVLSLTMATSGPDQRAALSRVRNDGRKLLASIENLLDLTQIEEHQLLCQPFDLGSIARDAADRARATAGERQVNIALIPEHDAKAAAIGDSWAMRRILDNLLDNAVRLTPPGGTVSATGLILSKRLARAMNGHLTAHNGAIQGAVVSLSLPAA